MPHTPRTTPPRAPVAWTHFTRRTDWPKLGFILAECRRLNIPTRRAPIDSMHGPIIDIPAELEHAADAILSMRCRIDGKPSPRGRFTLDDIADDAPYFHAYAQVQPSHKTSSEAR